MRRLTRDLVPDGKGVLVLVTTKELSPNASPAAADHRDSQALAFLPTGSFIGMSGDGELALGTGIPEMRHGVWYVHADPLAAAKWPNVVLSPENVTMRSIE